MNGKIGKALTWDELAEIFDESNPIRPARTLPMDAVFGWARKQNARFYVSASGTIHEKGNATPSEKQAEDWEWQTREK